MDPLLTPTTALLYSILEPSIFSPPNAQNPAANEPDIFSNAFGQHNFLKNDALERYQVLNCFPKESGWEAASCYISPPGSNDLNSHGTSNSPVENEGMSFCLYPLHAPILDGPPTSPMKAELLPGIPGYQPAGNVVHGSNAPILPKIRKTRNRKKRSLTIEEKELKHAQFLKRNRIAADNCRKRKKVKNERLEEQYKVLGLRNAVLKDMREDLLAEIRELKEIIGGEGSEIREGEGHRQGEQEEEGSVVKEHMDEDMLKEVHDWVLDDDDDDTPSKMEEEGDGE